MYSYTEHDKKYFFIKYINSKTQIIKSIFKNYGLISLTQKMTL